MILVIGRITGKNRDIVWAESNLCWIDPTQGMSPFDVNEFSNRITDCEIPDLLIWTNNIELINRLICQEIWQIEDGIITKHNANEIRVKYELSLGEIVTRNWLIDT
jgi:hypothetical protein